MMAVSRSALSSRTLSVLSLFGPWLAVAALAAWVAAPSSGLLAAAALGAGLGAFLAPGSRLTWRAGVGVLVLTVATGFMAHRQVDRMLADWDAYWGQREAQVGEILAFRLENRQRSAEEAADALAEKALDPTDQVDLDFVRDLRHRHGVSALALYDADGRLILWDGSHWGKVPESVQGGFLRHTYYDRPLFGYLYVTALTDDGRVVMAADLLRADLPEALEAGVEDFTSRFRADLGERVRVTQHDPGAREGVWDLALPDRRLMSVVVDRPEPDERAAEVMSRWRGRVGALALLGWVLLALGCPAWRPVAVGGALAWLAVAAALPWSEVIGLEAGFDAPVPGLPWLDVSLGRWAVVALSLATLVGALPMPKRRLASGIVGAGVAVAYAWVISWFGPLGGSGSVRPGRLAWVVAETGSTVALALVTLVLLAAAKGDGTSRWRLGWAVGSAFFLGAGAAVWVWLAGGPPTWWWLLWGVPAGLAAGGLPELRAWGGAVALGSLAVLLAATAAVPATWAAGVRADMAYAEDRLQALVSSEDTALAEGLGWLALAADSLDRAGRGEVDLLYHAWRASGLVGVGQPVRLTLWNPDGFRGVELRVGAEGNLPGVLPTLLAEQRQGLEPRLVRLNRDDARYVLTVPLSGGGILSVVAPPFSEGTRPSMLDPFVRTTASGPYESMVFIPLLPGDRRGDEALNWVRDGTEWRAEIGLRFANDRAYHAHYEVRLPTPLQALARGTLLLALNATLFGLFLGLGHTLHGWSPSAGAAGLRMRWPAISFRGRVTWALFGFFALANGLFGTLAYRTLSEASRRSAEVIAERVVDDAAVWYRALAGGMDRLGRQVGAELVEYRAGELEEGSVEELVELGLYDAWTPFEVRQEIEALDGVKRFTAHAPRAVGVRHRLPAPPRRGHPGRAGPATGRDRGHPVDGPARVARVLHDPGRGALARTRDAGGTGPDPSDPCAPDRLGTRRLRQPRPPAARGPGRRVRLGVPSLQPHGRAGPASAETAGPHLQAHPAHHGRVRGRDGRRGRRRAHHVGQPTRPGASGPRGGRGRAPPERRAVGGRDGRVAGGLPRSRRGACGPRAPVWRATHSGPGPTAGCARGTPRGGGRHGRRDGRAPGRARAGLGRDGASGRARGQEPAHPHQAQRPARPAGVGGRPPRFRGDPPPERRPPC